MMTTSHNFNGVGINGFESILFHEYPREMAWSKGSEETHC